MNRSAWVAMLALLMLPLAAAPLLGWWTLVVAAFVLPLVAARRLAPPDGGAWGGVVAALGLLGGGIGMVSAAMALIEVGEEAPYSGRVGFGVAALAMAGLALAGGALASARPRPAAGLLALSSVAGALAMSLFWIESWYVAALPPCWLAAALALLQPRRGVPASRPRDGNAGDARPTAMGDAPLPSPRVRSDDRATRRAPRSRGRPRDERPTR